MPPMKRRGSLPISQKGAKRQRSDGQYGDVEVSEEDAILVRLDEFTDQDIICGRSTDKKLRGNQAFRELIHANHGRYIAAACMKVARKKSGKRSSKKAITERPNEITKYDINMEIVNRVKASGGRFLCKDGGDDCWYVMSDCRAVKKTAQGFRDVKKTEHTKRQWNTQLADVIFPVFPLAGSLAVSPMPPPRLPPQSSAALADTHKVRATERKRKNAAQRIGKLARRAKPRRLTKRLVSHSNRRAAEPTQDGAVEPAFFANSQLLHTDVIVYYKPSADPEHSSVEPPDTHWPKPIYGYLIKHYASLIKRCSKTRQLELSISILQELRQTFDARFVANIPHPWDGRDAQSTQQRPKDTWRVMSDYEARRKIIDALLLPLSMAQSTHWAVPDFASSVPAPVPVPPLVSRDQLSSSHAQDAPMFKPIVDYHCHELRLFKSRFEPEPASPEPRSDTPDDEDPLMPEGVLRGWFQELQLTDVIVFYHEIRYSDDNPSSRARSPPPTSPGTRVMHGIIQWNARKLSKLKSSSHGSKAGEPSPTSQDYREAARGIALSLHKCNVGFYACILDPSPSHHLAAGIVCMSPYSWYKISKEMTIDWLMLQLEQAVETPGERGGNLPLPDESSFTSICQWLLPFSKLRPPSQQPPHAQDASLASTLLSMDRNRPSSNGIAPSNATFNIPTADEAMPSTFIDQKQRRHSGYLAFRWMLHNAYRERQSPKNPGGSQNRKVAMNLIQQIERTGGLFVERNVASAQPWVALCPTRRDAAVKMRFIKTFAYIRKSPATWEFGLGSLDFRDLCTCASEGWDASLPWPSRSSSSSPLSSLWTQAGHKIFARMPYETIRKKRAIAFTLPPSPLRASGHPRSKSGQSNGRGSAKGESGASTPAATQQGFVGRRRSFEVLDDATNRMVLANIFVPDKPELARVKSNYSTDDAASPLNECIRTAGTASDVLSTSIGVSKSPARAAARHCGSKPDMVHVVPQDSPQKHCAPPRGSFYATTPLTEELMRLDSRTFDTPEAELTRVTSLGMRVSSEAPSGPELLRRMTSWSPNIAYFPAAASSGALAEPTIERSNSRDDFAAPSWKSAASMHPRVSILDSKDLSAPVEMTQLLRPSSSLILPQDASLEDGGFGSTVALQRWQTSESFSHTMGYGPDSQTFPSLPQDPPLLTRSMSGCSRGSVQILDDSSSQG